MRFPSSFVITAVFLCAGIAGAPNVLEACSCHTIGEGPPALTPYDDIFLGTVVAVSDVKIEATTTARLAIVEVEGSWKGSKAPVQAVFTGTGAGDCGYPFEVDERVVVFTKKYGGPVADWVGEVDGAVYTDICTETTLFSTSGELRQQLEQEFEFWQVPWRRRR